MVVDLQESRKQIDEIDRQIVELLKKNGCCSQCCRL